MKEIIALQQYTDKYISLYEGEIRNIENILADKLIEQGIVAEHNESGNIELNELNEIKESVNTLKNKHLYSEDDLEYILFSDTNVYFAGGNYSFNHLKDYSKEQNKLYIKVDNNPPIELPKMGEDSSYYYYGGTNSSDFTKSNFIIRQSKIMNSGQYVYTIFRTYNLPYNYFNIKVYYTKKTIHIDQEFIEAFEYMMTNYSSSQSNNG